MTQNPILKVLSTFLRHRVKALLIGGQACILYGAAEFSRDIDLSPLITAENLEDLREVLKELEAEPVFYPDLSEDALLKGHACHFRCQRKDLKGLRIDVIGVMRGVDAFHELWKRRKEVEVPEIGRIVLIGLSDLVKSKKTQKIILQLGPVMRFVNTTYPEHKSLISGRKYGPWTLELPAGESVSLNCKY